MPPREDGETRNFPRTTTRWNTCRPCPSSNCGRRRLLLPSEAAPEQPPPACLLVVEGDPRRRCRMSGALNEDDADDPAKEGTSDDSSSDEEEEEEEGSSDPSSSSSDDDDDDTATRTIMQTQLFSMDRKVDAEERQEIGAIMDHLIAEGNYWRHRDWRLAQWRRSTSMTTTTTTQPAPGAAPAAASVVARAPTSSVDHDQQQQASDSDESIPGESGRQSTASRKRKKPPQQPSSTAAAAAAAIESEGNNAAKSTSAIDDILLHVPDARVYQESYNQGVEPGTWPLPPHRTNRRAKSEKQWDWELSDGVHPVAFSQMRLTRQTHPLPGCCGEDHTMQLPLDYDLDPDQTNCKVSGDDAPRAMLLRCWERAVHAAASTMDVWSSTNRTTTTSRSTTTPTGTDTRRCDCNL